MKFSRLFTSSATDPYELVHFAPRNAEGDSFDAPLAHPHDWSLNAVEILADEAAASALPTDVKAIEENTVPSWLWRQSRCRSVHGKETCVGEIFDRVVGGATYRGWKLGLFDSEDSARTFFDEARYALTTRLVALEPQKLATLGLSWAYGVELEARHVRYPPVRTASITNAAIDAMVSGRRKNESLKSWNQAVGGTHRASTLSLHFVDTEAQWEKPVAATQKACINLMYLRHNDGVVNIDALRHVTRLVVTLLDIYDNEMESSELGIGHANLATLLMALAIPYDSAPGRTMAAAINSIITAEAYVTSAELAELRGCSTHFIDQREDTLRAVRNHRRAAYGESNDYEKMTVTPVPLELATCPDLALTAAARAGWDHVAEKAQAFGLRHTQVTDLAVPSDVTLFMECDTVGIEPLHKLVHDGENTERHLHASVVEALSRLHYKSHEIQAIQNIMLGHHSLAKAHAINHTALRKHGFTTEIIANIEAYLPQAASLRHAVTPWVVGIEFCRDILKISAAQLDKPNFNLLSHLGFSEREIAEANAFCYGLDKLSTPALHTKDITVFATSQSVSEAATIRMAAAVQSFVSGETGLAVRVPAQLPTAQVEKILLEAWRRGVKSLTIDFDANMENKSKKMSGQTVRRKTPSKLTTSAIIRSKAPALPKRSPRSNIGKHPISAPGRSKPRHAGH